MGDYKTTAKDFSLFVSTCEEWIEMLGLLNWDVSFSHIQLGGNIVAQCTTNYRSRRAVLSLSKSFNDDSRLNIEESAIHEVLELFLSSLGAIAADRMWDEAEWDSRVHDIIHTLINVFHKSE